MIIDEEMGAEQIIEESVGKGVVQRISQYKYVGIHINELGNLNLHVDKMQERAMNVIKEIMTMGSNREVGGEWFRVRLELFEKCWVPAITHGLHAWTITPNEIKEMEKYKVNS